MSLGRTPAPQLAAAAGLLLLLGACADGPGRRAAIDPASPIAAEANQAIAARKAYPSFADVPPAPSDVRPPSVYAALADEVRAAGDRLVAETAPETWTLTGTEAFAAAAQRRAGADPGAAKPQDTEAFARSLRERATPPPPPR